MESAPYFVMPTSSYPYILDCIHRLNWIGLSGHRCFSCFFLYFFCFCLRVV